MTEVIEVQGKSLEDALQKAQSQLGVEKDDMEYEVIDSGSKGILGIIGAKSALIKAWKRQVSQGAAALEFLQPIFEQLGVHPLCNEELRDGILWLSFSGNGMGRVIGRRGETLDALQYLTNLAVNGRREDKIRIILDVEGYRQSREETLAALAKKTADRARRTGRSVALEPMSPHERRIIHIALQNDPSVQTLSEGEEPNRRVIVAPKRKQRQTVENAEEL